MINKFVILAIIAALAKAVPTPEGENRAPESSPDIPTDTDAVPSVGSQTSVPPAAPREPPPNTFLYVIFQTSSSKPATQNEEKE